MKKQHFTILVIFALIIGFMAGCEKDEDDNDNNNNNNNQNQTQIDVIVYGKPTCGMCTGMKNNLETEDIDYIWKDLNDNANLDECAQKLQDYTSWTSGSFGMPVVDVIVDSTHNVSQQPTIDWVKAFFE